MASNGSNGSAASDGSSGNSKKRKKGPFRALLSRMTPKPRRKSFSRKDLTPERDDDLLFDMPKSATFPVPQIRNDCCGDAGGAVLEAGDAEEIIACNGLREPRMNGFEEQQEETHAEKEVEAEAKNEKGVEVMMTLQEATPESSPKAEIKAEEADSAAHREIASETATKNILQENRYSGELESLKEIYWRQIDEGKGEAEDSSDLMRQLVKSVLELDKRLDLLEVEVTSSDAYPERVMAAEFPRQQQQEEMPSPFTLQAAATCGLAVAVGLGMAAAMVVLRRT